MSIGDKVCIMYKGRELLGIVNYEYDWASIIYMPLIKEQKLFVEQKITKWDNVDWITKIRLAEEVNNARNNQRKV